MPKGVPLNHQLRQTAPKCGARRTRDGVQTGDLCKNPAGQGTEHEGYGQCADHGGRTTAGKTAALREQGRHLLAKETGVFGGQIIDNETAEQILLEEVRRSAAMVRFLADHISQWEIAPDGETGLPRLLDPIDGKAAPSEARLWMDIYRAERDHLAKVSKMCIDTGLSQRMVDMAQRVTDTDAALLAGAIKQILGALNLTNEQAALVPKVVPVVLRRVAAGELTA